MDLEAQKRDHTKALEEQRQALTEKYSAEIKELTETIESLNVTINQYAEMCKEWDNWYAEQALEEGVEEVEQNLGGGDGDHGDGRAAGVAANPAATTSDEAGGTGGASAAVPSPPTAPRPPNPNQQVITIKESGSGADVNLVINSSSGRKNENMVEKFKVPGFPTMVIWNIG